MEGGDHGFENEGGNMYGGGGYGGGQSNDRGDDDRKLFIGGLSWETTVKDLREYFDKYGPVSDTTLKTDPNTGRSRGFGFVTFEDSSTVDKVLAERSHTLHGKNIDPKRALARGQTEQIKKIFVGGIDPSTPESDIREYFSQYGKVEEVDLPYDKVKNQRRAFCFVTFDSEQTVDSVCSSAKQTICGKEVDVKKATPQAARASARGGRGGGQAGTGPDGKLYSAILDQVHSSGGYGQSSGWGGDAGGQSGGYDYNNYYNQAGYSSQPGYDYNQASYGQSGQYDYNNYYNQGGWGGGGYDQSGYGQQQGGSYGQQQGAEGKSSKPQRGGGGGGGGGQPGYHPYQR